jgi:regulator of protease activity HflC (stomatin/prohibitin superfamily)
VTASSKRAEHIAWAALVLSVVFAGVAFLTGRWSGFFAVSAVSWHILATALVWVILAIQFHQRSLAEQEKLDLSQLAKGDETSTIFQGKGERATLFAAAQRRLAILEKWFIPIFAGLLACYQIVIGLYLLRAIPGPADAETQQPLLTAVILTAVAFVSFLISRYATGMAAHSEWKPLRAGGSLLLSVAVLCFVLAIGLALAQFQKFELVRVMTYVIPILLVVLGIETALNAVLDIYRPRLKGQYSRAAFDSRLLGIINEPGGLLHSLASAIDYQFGFKVSETWFYKLLEKWILALVLFGAVTLYLLSCVVVVASDEGVIIEYFGNPVTSSGEVRSHGPGIHLKWPWPIEIAYKYSTEKVMELNIGFVPKIDPKTGEPERGPLLWGKTHYEEEYSVLVASGQTGDELTEGALPVSLVKANIPVQYKIKNLHAHIYNHRDPARLLEAICYQELTKFAASSRVDVDSQLASEAELAESLFGAGRARAKRVLTQRIQEAADREGLGVKIVFLGVQGIHPPPEIAADYQAVVGAVQKKQASVLNALAERNKDLSTLVGSVEDAYGLYVLAARYQQAKDAGETEEAEKLGRLLDAAFSNARGDIFKTLRESQTYAFEKATLAKATGERFASQLKAYRAAKEIYKREQRLVVFEETLPGIRKYVVVADPNDAQVYIVDLKEDLAPDLWDVPGLQESGTK